MDEEQRNSFKRLIVKDLTKLSLVAAVGGSILYSIYSPSLESEEQTIVPASGATISALKQKCGGHSYQIVVEDFPGRSAFEYDSLNSTFAVFLGLSAAGVNECETFIYESCIAYKSDFVPSKWGYVDSNADGLVDFVMRYKQNRDGTEERLDLPWQTWPTPKENPVYVRNLDYFSKISPETTSPLVKVAPCSQ